MKHFLSKFLHHWGAVEIKNIHWPGSKLCKQWPTIVQAVHPPARNQPTQQEETSENQKKLLFTPRLCQRSERKDRAHLLPPGRQGDLQVITHSEATPDEGKDYDARGEENRGDLQGPLCRLKLRVRDCISSHRLKPSRHNCIIFYYHPHPLCT